MSGIKGGTKMEKDADVSKTGGKAKQDSNSGESARAKSPLAPGSPAFDTVAARQKARQTEIALLAKLKAMKPPRVVKMVEDIPAAYRGRAIRVLAGAVSGSKVRIRANCEQCVGWEEVSKRVGGCTVYGCMFWEVRPYQKTKGLKPDGVSV